MAKANYTKRYARTCLICKSDFIGFKNQFCCGKECSQINNRRKRGCIPIDEYESSRKNHKHYFNCKHCKKESYRALGGSQSRNVFCSYDCLKAETIKAKTIKAKVKQEINALLRIKKYKERTSFRVSQCVDCNKTLFCKLPIMGRPKKRCNECLIAYESMMLKANRRLYKARRKYNTIGEAIDVLKVFKRDRWKCLICGIDTPKELRGMNLDNSPELDHIIPLSKGGLHEYNNVQCLCRACNIIKSDKVMDNLKDYVIARRGAQKLKNLFASTSIAKI